MPEVSGHPQGRSMNAFGTGSLSKLPISTCIFLIAILTNISLLMTCMYRYITEIDFNNRWIQVLAKSLMHLYTIGEISYWIEVFIYWMRKFFNLRRGKCSTSSKLVCAFITDRKTKMATLAYDRLRYFRLLLWNRSADFYEIWPEAKSQRPLQSWRFSTDRITKSYIHV